MSKKYEDWKVDIRTLKLNFAKGNITQKEYNGYLKDLPDLSDQLIEIPAYEEPGEAASDTSGDLTFSVG